MARSGQRLPVVQRGVKAMADPLRPSTGDKEHEILFGDTEYAKRQKI